ncbi:uncharacterized protein HMPREF1541_08831 [Cyphellophora europaea CBS 101466]|uniref:DUF7924 domain-containing protein n=1 Tax=Cyphellophora europaea (strain CBS 101466) TaxID=1220924 RepID=W2RLH0_CYPE1|nr:uncharacterized protein HMPREF1541_08831 [Cyphellophora europaea CBS 101466]ETN36553.1 hypothetical protein HMPREF1541_08831 [Cyphellophora europaea CBS 101466]
MESKSSSHQIDPGTAKSPQLSGEQWTAAAQGMGINPFLSAGGGVVGEEEAARLSRKVGKRRKIEAKQMTEIMWSAIAPSAVKHTRTTITNDNVFNREPIPNYAPRLESTTNRRVGMFPPRPAITAGYRPQTFSNHQRELQHGLISDIDGAPRDLSKLSHICQDTYWPFFVVEISDTSMQAASDLAIDGTASCNNALMTLASALLNPNALAPDDQLVDCVNQSIASFALAIHKKSARLIAHYSEGFVAETVGVVQTYNLESETEMAAMLARIESIFAWAEAVRLRAITDLLSILDRRVNFSECVADQETAARGPMDVVGARGSEMGGGDRKGLFMSVIGSSMPSWSRVEI